MGCNCSRSARRNSTSETADSLASQANDANETPTNRILMMNALNKSASPSKEEKAHRKAFGGKPALSFLLEKFANNNRDSLERVNNNKPVENKRRRGKWVKVEAAERIEAGGVAAKRGRFAKQDQLEQSKEEPEASGEEPKRLLSIGQHLQVPSFSYGRRKSSEGSGKSKKGKKRRLRVEPESRMRAGSLATSSSANSSVVSESSSVMNVGSLVSLEGGQANEERREASNSAEEVKLFTSVQQLCHETINKRLLSSEVAPPEAGPGNAGKVLCLFLFGCQGSSKGELAYDLVQHSSLHKTLTEPEQARRLLEEAAAEDQKTCPLYYYLDVAGLIVANIDKRIREYHNLLARTMYNRRQQLEASRSLDDSLTLGSESLPVGRRRRLAKLAVARQHSSETPSLEEGSGSGELNVGKQLDANLELAEGLSVEEASIYSCNSRELDSRNPSICSDLASATGSAKNLPLDKVQTSDEFGQVTLSTKQRSILQLKLMKYYNSVTSKWIYGLIKAELDRLESLFSEKYLSQLKEIGSVSFIPSRVYLINLVPNQLNLFRTCLYLKQNSTPPEELLRSYPFWAIKFERRTNIKLLIKERAISVKAAAERSSNSSEKSTKIVKNLQLRIANIRLPILSSRARSLENLTNKIKLDEENKPTSGSNGNLLEPSKENEKLGPKFNESFSENFNAINKLIVMRYNPLRDYNYASKGEEEDAEEGSSSSGSGSRSPPSSSRGSARRMSCSQLLRRLSESSELGSESSQIINHDGSRLRLQETSPRPGSSRASSGFLTSGDESFLSPASASSLVTSPKPASKLLLPIAGAPTIKLAIELELLATGNKEELELESDEAGSTGARERLLFSPAGQRDQAERNAFKLTPARVAYANNQSQTVYEAKRYHSRTIKVKKSSDFLKLMRLIEKAKCQLESECRVWLNEALSSYNQQFAATSGRLHLKRHSISAGAAAAGVSQADKSNSEQQLLLHQHHQSGASKRVSLIVYAIKLDAGRIQANQFQFPANFKPDSYNRPISGTGSESLELRAPAKSQCDSKKLIAPILITTRQQVKGEQPMPSITTSLLPVEEAGRPLSSRSTGNQLKRPKRHVQFRLSRAPGPSRDRWNSLEATSGGKVTAAQRRMWIGDSLFVSANEEASNWLELLVELIKFYLAEEKRR